MSPAEFGKPYTDTAANGDDLYSYRTFLLLLFTKTLEGNKVGQTEFSIWLVDLTVIATPVFQNTFENLSQLFSNGSKKMKKKTKTMSLRLVFQTPV